MEVLKYKDWQNTVDTLGMYIQMVGKVALERIPQEPEWESAMLHITPTGISTGNIPSENGLFQISFNFIKHELVILDENGREAVTPLKDGVSVAQFYKIFLSKLEFLGYRTDIYSIPQEWNFTTPFEKDETHKSYDREAVEKWFEMIKYAYKILSKFAAPFRGRRTKINFYWGCLDMGTVRYSGKLLNIDPSLPVGFRYGVDAEEIEFGFNLGNNNIGEPYFFGFMWPNNPDEYKKIALPIEKTYYNDQFIYKLTDCLATSNPDESAMTFFQSVYEAATKIQDWQNLESYNKPLELPSQKIYRNK